MGEITNNDITENNYPKFFSNSWVVTIVDGDNIDNMDDYCSDYCSKYYTPLCIFLCTNISICEQRALKFAIC
jgi:hypothetical protein